jgi:hypothetical protein
LVLHFDINETILIGDEAGGDTVEDVMNKMLAKSAFVRIPDSPGNTSKAESTAKNDDPDGDGDDDNSIETYSIVPTHWWDGTPILEGTCNCGWDDPPTPRRHQRPPPLYTGWTWPPRSCPYYRTSFKSRAKTFVRRHGAPYRPLYEQLSRRLGLENSISCSANFGNGGGGGGISGVAEDDDLRSHCPREQQQHVLLPALFVTLVELSRRRVPHTVVLRTFGTDLARVARKLVDFAEGRHPDHPGFCDPRYALGPSRLYVGRWVRRDSRKEGSEDGKEKDYESNKKDDHDCYVYQLRKLQPHANAGDGDEDDAGAVVVADGDEQVLELLHDDSTTICGIQDDYEFWSAHRCRPWAGKPVWKLPPSATTADSTGSLTVRGAELVTYHHILFDDNIQNSSTDSIACVRVAIPTSTFAGDASAATTPGAPRRPDRCAERYRTMTGTETLGEQGVHLIRVPTLEVVMKPTWFLEQVDRAIERYCTDGKFS